MKNITTKINTGHVLEWPPDGDKFPVWADVPAREEVILVSDGRDEYLKRELVPILGPEYDRLVAEAIQAAEKECSRAWEQFRTENPDWDQPVDKAALEAAMKQLLGW